ncbi:hypothetical protein QYF36_016535 [Acer negundo]|nr:hypothetical protein QYF36_016535 [Acer negundo]
MGARLFYCWGGDECAYSICRGVELEEAMAMCPSLKSRGRSFRGSRIKSYQAGDPSQSALGMTKLAPPRPNKLTDVKKEEGPKHAHLVRPNKPSILELEAKLGHNQGNKGKGVRKALKVHAFMEREPSTFNKGDVVQAFRRIGLGGGLSSLSLTPALGSNASLPWNNWLYLFRRRCAFERRRADVEAQLNQVELALVHLSAVKWKAEQTQVMIAGQVICWKLDLEKEVIRSTPHSYERNELRKKLVVKEKEMEAVPRPLLLTPIQLADDMARNNRPSKGDAGTAKVQDKGEDKNGEDLKGAGVGSGGYEGHRA